MEEEGELHQDSRANWGRFPPFLTLTLASKAIEKDAVLMQHPSCLAEQWKPFFKTRPDPAAGTEHGMSGRGAVRLGSEGRVAGDCPRASRTQTPSLSCLSVCGAEDQNGM